MGRVLLIGRLAARDLRRRRGEAVMLLIAITAATATLTLGLVLHGVTSQPYQQTRAATNGPDVVAYLQTSAQATALIRASGVVGHGGPYPTANAILQVHGLTAGVEAEGRTQAPAAVDQPKLTVGRWVRPGSVVIERTFAEALGAGPGARVTMNGRSFTVAGIAVTAAKPPYPNICENGSGGCDLTFNGISAKDTGLIWMTEPDVTKLGAAASPAYNYVLNLKLSDSAAAQAFANRNGLSPSGRPGRPASPRLATWEEIAASDGLLVQDEQAVLTPGAIILALLAVASVAVLVGGRLTETTRRVGLLKAVGGTPGLVAAAFLAENVVLALIAAAAGMAAGWLAAPLITSPGAALVGTAGAPSLTLLMAAEVVGVAVAVALASTLTPAIRAARTSTVSALADAARPPRRRGALIRISRALPVPVLFGLRLVARRPRRAVLSAASIAVTVCGIVAVLAFHATVDEKLPGGSSGGLANPVVDRDEQMLLVLTVMLVTLSALNAIFTAWATVMDARRASALVRALGASSHQISAGLAAAQALSALPGAIIGLPMGIGLFAVANGGGAATIPPVTWLVTVVLGTVIAVAGITAIPARIGARRPVAGILQSETA